MLTTDEKYMRRCIQLARNGMRNAPPNPMVGAVIVCGDRIIGEGYHVRCGEGHAEVNACASVRPEDECLLPQSTIYVSLEPCSHYGKTPPCAELLIRKGFRRCVVGCQDPFAKVSGRGIGMLREAGMEVTVGVLEEECRQLNARFMTFHGKCRPFVTLKWAQSSDGFIDGHISNPHTQMLCHKRRAEHQAILVGHRTAMIDRPSLTTREWPGPSPRPYVCMSRTRSSCAPRSIHPNENSAECVGGPYNPIVADDVDGILRRLYEDGMQSVLVEGGAQLLQSFIDSGLWDECFVETGDTPIGGKVTAPTLPRDAVRTERNVRFGHVVERYVNV